MFVCACVSDPVLNLPPEKSRDNISHAVAGREDSAYIYLFFGKASVRGARATGDDSVRGQRCIAVEITMYGVTAG